jgi:hypothetical protein
MSKVFDVKGGKMIKVFDVHETFSSVNQIRKIFISAEAVGFSVRSAGYARIKWWTANVGTTLAAARYGTRGN